MKTLKKITALLFALLMTVSLITSCSPAKKEEEKKTYSGTYEEMINAFYEDNKATAAGAMIGVFGKNGTIFEGYYGYSDIASQTKVDEKTVIDWGSSTKILVWVSVMQLWEQGKIDLEKDVREYLPDGFLTNLRYDKPVRMIDLMNHRAGFQEYYTDMFLRPESKAYTLEEALKLEQPPQIFEPDTLTAYSNWGVALAGYIVERISGENFADYVHKHIFEPLDMKETALTPDLMDNPEIRERRDKLTCYTGTVPAGSSFYLISLYPAGACVSTLKDYIKFASCFVKDKFPLFEKQETFDELMKPTSYYADTKNPKNVHGIWALPYGSDVYGHGGNTRACSSYITFDVKRQVGCVVMTNQASEKKFNYDLFEAIYGEPAWQTDNGTEAGKGLYHPARTMLEGHFKIMGASYLSEDNFKEWNWTYNEKNGIPKIEMPYGDYYYCSTAQVLPDVILVYGWIATIVFAVASLITKGIRAIVRKARKSTKKIVLGKMTGLMSLVELVIDLLGAVFAIMMTSWMNHSTYEWIFPVIGIIGAILAIMTLAALVIFIKTPAKESSVIRKIYNIAAILCAVLNVVFFFYMQLWR